MARSGETASEDDMEGKLKMGWEMVGMLKFSVTNVQTFLTC